MSVDDFDLTTAAYDFELPADLIAQYPAAARDSSRLMIFRGGKISHALFSALPDFLERGDLLVRNNTQVIPARIFGRRATGGKVEILLIRPTENGEPQSDSTIDWQCLVKPLKNLRLGEEIIFARRGAADLRGILRAKTSAGQAVFSFDAASPAQFLASVNQIGDIPLPPYIARAATALDRERYQTIYAKIPGAVAAPTAGLHFTESLWDKLAARGVECAEITLHVGPGTFKPVMTDTLREHAVDAEYYDISTAAADSINRARAENRRIIAVGTTSARALESAALATEARESARIAAGGAQTNLFIFPGYRWRLVTGLLTNFHLPKSSLLALTAALVGREKILAAYREAIALKYRFYSYGDASLLLPN